MHAFYSLYTPKRLSIDMMPFLWKSLFFFPSCFSTPFLRFFYPSMHIFTFLPIAILNVLTILPTFQSLLSFISIFFLPTKTDPPGYVLRGGYLFDPTLQNRTSMYVPGITIGS